MKKTSLIITFIVIFTLVSALGFYLGFSKDGEKDELIDKALKGFKAGILDDTNSQEDITKINNLTKDDLKLICEENNHYLYLVDTDYFSQVDKDSKAVVGIYAKDNLYFTYTIDDWYEKDTDYNEASKLKENCDPDVPSLPITIH